MVIFAIDDDPQALQALHDAIAEAAPGAGIADFPLGTDALQAIEGGARPDVVFTDIRMPRLDGVTLAKRTEALSPLTKFVFVSAHADYAFDAIQARASGYLLKPVDVCAIRRELDRIAPVKPPMPDGLWVRCFGSFEVYWNRKPLLFGRRQTKELFAYLIDREGDVCTAEEIISALWEGETDLGSAKARVRQLVSDLKATLTAIGMGGLLVRRSGRLAILRDQVNCDYYRMLDGDMSALNAYYGDYMTQYSWAELTTGRLYFRMR